LQIANDFALALTTDNPLAISPYTLQVTVNGCTSLTSEPAVVELNEIPVATASNNGPICAGETVQLFAGDVVGATYAWRIQGESEIISTNQNPELFKNYSIYRQRRFTN